MVHDATVAHCRAAVSIFACTISGGLVAVPGAYQHAAILPSLALACVAAGTNGLSLLLLGRISERTGGLTSYGAVAGHVLGPVAAAVLDLIIGLFLVGVLAGSFIVLRDWFDALFLHDLVWTRLATALAAVIVVFPLSLPRSVGILAHAGILAVCAFTLLVGVLVAYGAEEVAAGQAGALRPVWWPEHFDPLRLGLTFNVEVYSFACQFQLMDIYQDLATRVRAIRAPVGDVGATSSPLAMPLSASPPPLTRVRFGIVVAAATGAMLALGSVLGIFGVLAFPGITINGNVLETLESKPRASGVIWSGLGSERAQARAGMARLGGFTYACLAAGVAMSAPLMLYPARACLLSIGRLLASLLGGGGGGEAARGAASTAVHVGLTAAIVATALAIALAFDQVMVLIGYLAAFVLVPLGFAFPALALLRLPPSGLSDPLAATAPPISRPAEVIRQELLLDVLGDGAVQHGARGGAPRRAAWRAHGVGTLLGCAWLVLVAAATIAIKIATMATGSQRR